MRACQNGLIALTVCVGLATPAFACQGLPAGSPPQLDEDFRNPDIGWGKPDQTASYTQNGLVLRPPPNQSAWRWNQNFAMARADLCLEVFNPTPLPTPANAQTVGDVGAWFWSRDGQNFFTATISLDGTAAVDRLVNGSWQVIVPPTRTSAVRTAAGAVNEIEVIVNGNAGTLYVNGSRIADFHGQAPPGGGPPGVYGESGPDGTAWLFRRVMLY
jgi:hypothetical protein